MITPSIPLVLAAAMTLTPLDAGQQARLAAWLEWAAAYRDCYAPAAYSLRIDQGFTAGCIEHTLRREERGGPPEQRAATDALIVATPRLIALLNTPIGRKEQPEAQAPDDAAPLSTHRSDTVSRH